MNNTTAYEKICKKVNEITTRSPPSCISTFSEHFVMLQYLGIVYI